MSPPPSSPHPGLAGEVLLAFLKLGLTSFGGPVAHLGYFRDEFVQRRRWLDDRGYADLVALCQFLPGPASSQLGMALGLQRAGWAGALAAWIGFTLPSALLMGLLALGLSRGLGTLAPGALHGLKLVAVAVVAQAVWGMARTLCPDLARRAIAAVAALLVLALSAAPAGLPAAGGATAAVGAMILGGLAGRRLLPADAAPVVPLPDAGIGRRTGAALLVAAVALLVALPLAAAALASPALQALAVFYQAGALVFGGGHVVLPLLHAGVVPPGWIGDEAFLAGYGAAQALPGPLFSFSAYLGALLPAPLGGWPGAALTLVAIFLPGFLLVAGALPFWTALRARDGVRRALGGINAAVVGVLGAALVDPVGRQALQSPADVALALAALVLLMRLRVPAPWVVAGAAAVGAWMGPTWSP